MDTQIKNSSNVTSYEQVSSTEIHISKVFYRIEYDFVLLENNNVGSDWKKSVFVNGKSFKSGDALFVNSGKYGGNTALWQFSCRVNKK